jgi:hypothetical protein
MAVVGTKMQEEKLKEFAKMAKDLFPDVNELAIKGALRYGIKAAIEESQFSGWDEVADQSSQARRKFFDILLQEAKPQLEIQIGKEHIDGLIRRIKLDNEKYIKKNVSLTS